MRAFIINDAILYIGNSIEIMEEVGEYYSVITDPPYEIRQKCGTSTLYGNRRMQFDFDEEGVTENVVIPVLKEAFKKAQSFHVFCNPEQYKDIAIAARENGMTPKPWAKQKLCSPPPMPGNWWPSSFELACYGYRKNAYFGDDSATRKNMMVFDSYRHGIREHEKVDHPTQKWLPMMEYLVNTIVPLGGTVFDPFMGSGTTGIAAIKTGRKFIGIEKDEDYFHMACERVKREYSQGKLF